MANIKLYRISKDDAHELEGYYANLEKELQNIIEKHMQKLFGIRLLAHEYGTGRSHPGKIDSLGLDENFCPVIIEFKRRNNENVITQGLYYMDWLLEHEAEFRLLVSQALGLEAAANVEFSGTRLLCIASSFGKYDKKAINRIDRRIELVRYKFFEEDLLMLELPPVNAHTFLSMPSIDNPDMRVEEVGMPASLQVRMKNMSDEAEDLYIHLLSFIESLGEDVGIKFLKHYVAFTRLKNFTSLQPMKNFLKIWINLDPSHVSLEEGFSRDVSNIGHHSSGNIEIDIHSLEDLEKAKPLISEAYQHN